MTEDMTPVDDPDWRGAAPPTDTSRLGAVRKIWQAHGGRQHGPRVETWTIPESKMLGFVRALLRQSRTRYQLEEVLGCLAEYKDAPCRSALTRLYAAAEDAQKTLEEGVQ